MEDADDWSVLLAASISSCLYACLYCELLWHSVRPLRAFGCDWVDCWATAHSFRPHNLPHTDTGYVHPSSCCLLVLTGGLPTILQSVEPPPPPLFSQNDDIFYSLLTNVTWFVLPFFLAFHAEAVRSGYAGRIRQNSMSVYKQPNAKFMSCGISCSVINYRRWFQVKKANCSPSSLLTLRDSLVIESNAVHELQHADKLDKSCRATLRLTCLGTFTFWREEKKKNKGHMQVKIYEAV